MLWCSFCLSVSYFGHTHAPKGCIWDNILLWFEPLWFKWIHEKMEDCFHLYRHSFALNRGSVLYAASLLALLWTTYCCERDKEQKQKRKSNNDTVGFRKMYIFIPTLNCHAAHRYFVPGLLPNLLVDDPFSSRWKPIISQSGAATLWGCEKL